MYPLPINSNLGRLEIYRIYDEYDGPKLFSVVNALQLHYLVYWIDENENGDTWLYVPMSKDRLNELESGNRSLRDAYVYPEENRLFEVYTAYDGSDFSINEYSAETLDPENFPPAGFHISSTGDVESIDTKAVSSDHEIHISKPSKRSKLDLDLITRVLTAWSDVYEKISSVLDINDRLTPVDARPGSFILRLQSNRFSEVLPTINDFFGILNNSDDVHDALIRSEIDIDVVKEFLSTLVDSDYDFKLNYLVDDFSGVLLEKEQAKNALNRILEAEKTYVSSLKVPQADDLKRVFEVVRAKASYEVVNAETLGITPRQVAYYLHACRTLGYLNKSNMPTAAGMQFKLLSQEQKFVSAAMRFQSSDCGWAWINWSNGKTLQDIPEDSALPFLYDCVPTLNENTAKRRSRTLNAWLRILRDRT
ncbi:DUF6575 domain-containing protein [Photobacterium halotolerans]|uniref:DUF6575 domain-containing protein n=1 Tax=Photobacterium halotolerans TaxID=265726 RepID=UPI000407D8AB|nr:DUF6575 domain-containing protein [Photobacterium halotolerans]